MPKEKTKPNKTSEFDYESLWSMSMLAKFANKDRATIKKLVKDLPERGTIKGYPAFHLQEAVVAIFSNDYYAQDGDLKPGDRKAFYESELKRYEVEERSGQLIPSERGNRYLANLFKEMDLRLSMLPDNIERKEGIKPELVLSIEQEVDKVRLLLISAISDVDE